MNGQKAEKTIDIKTAGWGDLDADQKTTPTPSTTTPEPTPSTTTPEPTPSTTTPEPEPSVSTPSEAPKVLAHTGASTAVVLLAGALTGTLGAMLSRRRAQ